MTLGGGDEPVSNPGHRLPEREPGLSPFVFTGAPVKHGIVESVLSGNTSLKREQTEEEEKMDPLIQELYQLYRPGVRGWFEAAYFTRRTLVVILVVNLLAFPIWRQVCVSLALYCDTTTQKLVENAHPT